MLQHSQQIFSLHELLDANTQPIDQMTTRHTGRSEHAQRNECESQIGHRRRRSDLVPPAPPAPKRQDHEECCRGQPQLFMGLNGLHRRCRLVRNMGKNPGDDGGDGGERPEH